MMKLVGFVSILFSLQVHALVPVEGVLLGEAQESIQSDPLKMIFSNIYDESQVFENSKVKLYFSTYQNGENLKESCSYLGAPVYASPWQEKQARRSVAATLQYIGLDTSIKAIGAYAKRLELSPENYKTLSDNLVRNYCSKNITVFSLKTIQKALDYYYQNPQMQFIPSIANSPFVPQTVKTTTEKPSARSKEFDLVIRNFRSFCSWGGETEDYRLLTSYLNNPFIMAFVFKNLSGFQDKVNEKTLEVKATKDYDNTVQVACTELICRREKFDVFAQKFPLTSGSTGISTDLSKIYCHHFRFQDSAKTSVPEVKAWIKAQELEDPVFETSQFLSLMTRVPDFFNGVETYRDIHAIAKSSIDDRWNLWSRSVLSNFSHDLLYEESLNVKVKPNRNMTRLKLRGFEIDFQITLGEMDRIVEDNDKLHLSFDLKLSKNYIRMVRTKWNQLLDEVDLPGQKQFRDEIARYLDAQLKEKQKLFTQKMWSDEFSRIIADELVQQAMRYSGPMFNSYQDEMLNIPVTFSYGLFALSYLHYRADVNAGRLKLSL